MHDFVRCLKIPAGFDADDLIICFRGAVPGLGLSFLLLYVLIRHKRLVFGRNVLTSVVVERYPTYLSCPRGYLKKNEGMAKRVRSIQHGGE